MEKSVYNCPYLYFIIMITENLVVLRFHEIFYTGVVRNFH